MTRNFSPTKWLWVVFIFWGALSSAKSVIYVDHTATGANTGASWTDAYTTVGNALVVAASGDEVWVAEGRYPEGSLLLKTGVGLYGGYVAGTSDRDYKAHSTILDGSGHAHVITVNYVNYTTIDGFVITGGNAISGSTADKVGGGVRYANCNNSKNLIQNCVITGNTAVYGGGIGLIVGSALISNNTIMDNTAAYKGYGGGIYSKNSQHLLIENNLIANNRLESTLYDGGGVYLEIVLFAEVRNNIIVNNFCNRYGGGLALSDSRQENVTVENNIICGNKTNSSAGGFLGGECVGVFRRNIICGNTSQDSGGVQVGDDDFLMENNLIVGNTSTRWAGGIFFTNGSVSVFRNNVIANNRGIYGGGLAIQAGGHPSIKHNIFAENNNYDICPAYPQLSRDAIPTSIEYNDFWGNSEGVFRIEDTATEYPTVADMDANLSVAHDNLALNPLFAGDLIEAVTWTADATYDSDTFQTTFYASSAGWPASSLSGLFLNPDAANQNLQFYIVDNTADTITVWADASDLGTTGLGSSLYNYRLQTPAEGAPVLSPLVDAGDLDADPSSEPDYNGNRVNLGAYGCIELAERTNANPAISGKINSEDGRPVPKVEVQFSGQDSVMTRSNGYYTNDVPSGYSGTVTPVKPQYTFNPQSRNYLNVTKHHPQEAYVLVTYPPVIHVDVDAASGEQTGLSWKNAFLTIGEALASSLASQEIWVAEGTYPEGNMKMYSQNCLYGGFTGTESVRDQRDPDSHETIIDGQSNYTHILILDSVSNVTIDGFTIQGGYAPDTENEYTWSGGGILCLNGGGSIVFSNNIITKNVAIDGGGVYIHEASPTIRNNHFIENSVLGYGGAILADYSYSIIENNLFSANEAGSGGGLHLYDFAGSLIGNTIIDNQAINNSTYEDVGNGGGLYLYRSEGLIENNQIKNNCANGMYRTYYNVGLGGGIYSENSANTIRNNDIIENRTYSSQCDDECGNGGGIYANGGSYIENNRILGNVAENGLGGGVYFEDYVTLTNNTIVGNRAISGLQSYSSYETGLDGLGGGVFGWETEINMKGNLVADNLADEEGGGVWIYEGILEQNTIIGNQSAWYGGGGYLYQTCAMKNNLVVGNIAGEYGGGLNLGYGKHEIVNNTFAMNVVDSTDGGGGICLDPQSLATIKNNIFSENNCNDLYEWNAACDPVEIGYNDFWDNSHGIYYDEGTTALVSLNEFQSQVAEAVGNNSVDPLFVGDLLAAGNWTADCVFSSTDFQTTLVDSSASLTANELVGCYLNPSSATGTRQFYIVANTSISLTVWGDASAVAASGDPYRIFDYHLQNIADGHSQNSPCIDAGDPISDYSFEPGDNGGCINQGCYGNTLEAARSSGAALSDINRDGYSNSLDLFLFSRSWQEKNATSGNPCNPDRDTDVDECDLLYFIPDWK